MSFNLLVAKCLVNFTYFILNFKLYIILNYYFIYFKLFIYFILFILNFYLNYFKFILNYFIHFKLFILNYTFKAFNLIFIKFFICHFFSDALICSKSLYFIAFDCFFFTFLFYPNFIG